MVQIAREVSDVGDLPSDPEVQVEGLLGDGWTCGLPSPSLHLLLLFLLASLLGGVLAALRAVVLPGT